MSPTEGSDGSQSNGIDTNTLSEQVKAQAMAQLLSDPEFLAKAFAQAQAQQTNDQAKWSNLYNIIMLKSKLPKFQPDNGENIRDFLEQLWDEISGSARNLCSWDLETKPLSDPQYNELLLLKLDYSVKRDVLQKFKSYDPVLTWKTVSKVKIGGILLELYGNKKPQISCVLETFAHNRFKKSPETSVVSFNCKWQEQLPLCLSPKTEEEKEAFHDLILRTAYYHALDDTYIQKELSNIPEEDQSLVKFQSEAIKAEARRIHFSDTAEKSVSLDSSSNISVNRTEYIPTPNRSRGRGYGNRRPRRGRGSGSGSGARGGAPAPAAAGGTQNDHRPPTHTPTPQYHQQAPHGGARGRGYPRQKYVPVCYICNIPGHYADKCYYKDQSYGNYGASANSKVNVDELYEEDSDAVDVNQFACDSGFTAFKFDVESSEKSVGAK